MKTAYIDTKETDLEFVRGTFKPGLVPEPRDLAFTSLKYLYSDLTDIRKHYIRLGFHLEEFSRCEYYRDFGFSTLEEFCAKNLGLDKSAVSRCINVYRAFNASNSFVYKNGIKIKGAAIELGEQWKDYSYTQLCEMLPLTPGQRMNISPDMSVKQIREYKKTLKLSEKFDSVALTQPESFDYKGYNNSPNEIVRQNIVKESAVLKENVVFDVFDKDGKFLCGNVVCDLIYAGHNDYFFRLHQSKDFYNGNKND